MESLARTLTNERAAATLLADSLPGFRDGQWRIDTCRVEHCRRRISQRILHQGGGWIGVVWRLAVHDPATGQRGVQWLYGKAFTHGRGTEEYDQAVAEACARPNFGTPIEHLREPDVLVWALPNDPGLSALPAFLDSSALARHLPPELRPDRGVRVRAEVVRHEPEEHCTARFETLRDGHLLRFYGKCYAGERWRDAQTVLDALWQQANEDPAAFMVGRPLGCNNDLGALWQAEVSGTPLAQSLSGRRADEMLERLAAALLRLQRSGPRVGVACRAGDWLALARKWRKKLSLADDVLAAPADAVLRRLEAEAPADGEAVPVHGDFHVDQMLASQDRIALFDYDGFGLGSPAQDLADFVSQLLCRDDGLHWVPIAGALVARYRQRAGAAFDEGEFDWHLRLMLMRKAYSFFVRSRSHWPLRAHQALAVAGGSVAGLTRPPRRESS